MATTLCDQMLTKIDQMVSNIAQCEAFYQPRRKTPPEIDDSLQQYMGGLLYDDD